MNCKYCGAELQEDGRFCPECGKAQDAAEQTTAAPETAAAQSAPEASGQETPEQPQKEAAQTAAQSVPEDPKSEQPQKDAAAEKKERRKSGWLLGTVITVLVVIIALITMKIVRDSQIKNVDTATTEETVADASTDAADPSDKPDDALDSSGDGESTEIPLNGVSYTVRESELTDEVMDRVVAVCGELQLTNRTLPIYYWQQYMSFTNTYGMYLSYLMDTSLPLDQQMYDEEHTWQQQFVDGALRMFQYHASMAQEAEANGYEMTQTGKDLLASVPEELESTATGYGFASADEYLKASYGPSVTMDEYLEFLRIYLLGSEYLDSLLDTEAPTDEQLSQYFDDNAESYASQGIEKIDKPMVNVRHILIKPEAAEDGTISDEAWAAAEKTANDILDQWLAGEKTEDSFATLANEASSDPGSNTNGGLYEDVYPGQMVETFNDWCFADGRQVGDYGIVKTDYGYHVMFFSGVGSEIYWQKTAREDYLSECSAEIQDEILERYPWEAYPEQSALVDLMFSADNEAAE